MIADSNWENRVLFFVDNFKFLRAMNSESVDLIVADLPFNAGRDFHATPDRLAEYYERSEPLNAIEVGHQFRVV